MRMEEWKKKQRETMNRCKVKIDGKESRRKEKNNNIDYYKWVSLLMGIRNGY